MLWGIVALNITVSLWALFENPSWLERYWLSPNLIDAQPYRLLTSTILHASILHLVMNMLALISMGAMAKRIGDLLFLLLYTGSALGGSVLVWRLSDPESATVGASGAIFGLFGALLFLGHSWKEVGGNLMVIIINLGLTFAIPQVSWQAHVGGLCTGAVLGLVTLPLIRHREKRRAENATPGVLGNEFAPRNTIERQR